ncbi:MAG: hypothetical protein JWN67_3304 [Actinomycetia bacterium]|nr:hypothetical protein [Actinomycetes bacterium]
MQPPDTDIEVRITDVPVDLDLESHAQLQDAVRELWIALSGASPDLPMTGNDAADVEDLIRAYGPQSQEGARQAQAARDAGATTCTLVMQFPADAAHDAPRLMELLERVDRLREQELYASSARPELLAYRRWLAAEIARQIRT